MKLNLYDYVTQRHISLDVKDRPGTKRPRTTKLVWHYTGNPGATDEGHFIYYEKVNDRYASAHIFVDNNSATEIIPLDEIAYHASEANQYAIGIELCQEKDGSFHPDTIARAVHIGAVLCEMFNLDPIQDQIRHYDVTGKICPMPWVVNPELFYTFREDVKQDMAAKLDQYVASHVVSIIQYYHKEMEGNVEAQDFAHWLANQIRAASGLPLE